MREIFRLCRILPVLAWVSLACGQWKPLNGPAGPSVTHAVILDSALILNTVWGVYRSGDHGARWDSLPPLGMRSFAWNFLLHQGDVYVFSDTEIVRYDKNLRVWAAVASPPGRHVSRAASFGSNLYVVATDYSGQEILRTTEIMQSSDKGRTWTAIYSVSAMSPIYQLAVDSLGIFALTEKELLRSGDNGAHWTTSPSPLTLGATGLLVIKGGSLFLTDAVTLFRSPDSGLTWKPSLTLGDSMWLSGLSRVGNSLYVARVEKDFRMTLLRSDDDGASWQEISRFFNGYQGREIKQIIALGNELFAATFSGLFRSSDNGMTWSPQNFGMSRSYFKSLVTMPDGGWLGLERFGLFQSRDSGANWQWVEDTAVASLQQQMRYIFAKDSLLFTSLQEQGIFRSADGGRHWKSLGDAHSVSDPGRMAYLGADLFILADDGKVWKSLDQGVSWVSSSAGSPSYPMSGLAVCHGALFVLGDSATYRYRQASGSWERIASLPEIPDREFFFSDGTSLYLSGWNGPSLRSVDDGLTWKKLDGVPDSAAVTCAVTLGGAVFAGAKAGLFAQPRAFFSKDGKDGGAEWSAIGEGMPHTDVLSLRIQGDYLLATTLRGLYKRPLKEFSGVGIKAANEAANGRRGPRVDPIRAKLVRGKVVWRVPGNAKLGPIQVDSQGKKLP